ncbi:MAG: hypothetical protein AAFX99_06095 [Myxococcota bacterium]
MKPPLNSSRLPNTAVLLNSTTPSSSTALRPRVSNPTLRPHHVVGWVLWLALMTLATTASAQMTDDEKQYLEEKEFGPSRTYIIAPRIRGVWIADWQLDLFFDEHASHWDDRANMEYGLEFILRAPGDYQLVFGASWADISMPNDWWLEKDEPPRKADWTTFQYQLLVVDVSYYKEWEISDVFAIYAGGGLGVGIFLGESTKRDPSAECLQSVTISGANGDLNREPCRTDQGVSLDPLDDGEDTGIPPALPWINLTVGSQLTIAEQAIVRVDTGFRGYWFAGLSFGYQWW